MVGENRNSIKEVEHYLKTMKEKESNPSIRAKYDNSLRFIHKTGNCDIKT